MGHHCELSIGIQCSANAGPRLGCPLYKPWFTFSSFCLRSRSLETGDSRTLELSPRHFLPTSKEGRPNFSRAVTLRAEDVGVGYTVWAAQGAGVAPFRVAAVEVVEKEGLWAPYTAAGNILVSRAVLCSLPKSRISLYHICILL